MSKAFFRTVGDELSAAAKVAKGDIAGVATAAKNEMKSAWDSDGACGSGTKEGGGLVMRTKAEDVMIAAPASSCSSRVLLSGPLKKRDGALVKKWIDVHCELRENSITCFASADKTQVVDTLVIDAGIECHVKERDKLPALILKKAPGRGPAVMAKELVLGAESEGLRDRWAEMLEACCLKVRTHVEARKMVQEEAASRARAEAELQRKALEEAARARRRSSSADGSAGGRGEERSGTTSPFGDLEDNATTFALIDLNDLEDSVAASTLPPAAGAETPPPARTITTKPVLQPVTPVEPPDGKRGGRVSMTSRMRSAFSFKGNEGSDSKGEAREQVDEEQRELEESLSNMMLAEANTQLRQLQEELRLEREEAANLRDQIRTLTSDDKGAKEMMEQLEQARDAARKAEQLLQEARGAESAAQAELASLRAAAAATAGKRAEEAAVRDLQLSQEAEEQEAMRRQVASLREEIVRLQGELEKKVKDADARLRAAAVQAAGADASVLRAGPESARELAKAPNSQTSFIQ